MSDEIIKELWKAKDAIAREHGYDVDALVANLQAKHRGDARHVVDLHAMRKNAEKGASADASPSGR